MCVGAATGASSIAAKLAAVIADELSAVPRIVATSKVLQVVWIIETVNGPTESA
jgi:hypothetical protein